MTFRYRLLPSRKTRGRAGKRRKMEWQKQKPSGPNTETFWKLCMETFGWCPSVYFEQQLDICLHICAGSRPLPSVCSSVSPSSHFDLLFENCSSLFGPRWFLPSLNSWGNYYRCSFNIMVCPCYCTLYLCFYVFILALQIANVKIVFMSLYI